jgi:transporter family-2 protein
MTTWGYGLWAFCAGVLIPVMAALNARLGRGIGSPGWATALLCAVALAASVAFAVASSGAPPVAQLSRAPPTQLLAGLVMSFYVLSATYLAPRFGLAPTILLVVVAQIVTSATVSHFGWLGAPRQPIDLIKAAGIVLMIAGVGLVQWRRTAA